MANYTNLKNSISSAIKDNGNNEITGNQLQQILIAMVSNLGAEFQFAGRATQSTNPGTPDYNVAYFAGPGTYQNMGGLVVPSGNIGILTYNGNWDVQLISVGSGGGGSVITFNSLPNGTTVILVDGVQQAVIPSQYTLLKLSAFTTTPSGLADGSFYYNTSDKKIYQKQDPTVAVIPYYDGAIYTYNNALYVWNGTDLVNVSGGGGGSDPEAVKYTPQSLTTSQKEQARTNIGAGTYSKPSGGIPASDLANGVIPTVPTISTNITADAASDVKTASPKAVKTYVDGVASAINEDIADLGISIETIGNGAFVIAWDGESIPIAAKIPSGVSVTYEGETYTGSNAASASTLGKIYLVATGTSGNYDRYVTVGDSTYSWVRIGTTSIPLDELEAKVNDLGSDIVELDGKIQSKAELEQVPISQNLSLVWESGNIKPDGTTANTGYHCILDVNPGDVFSIYFLQTTAAYGGHPLMFQKDDDSLEVYPDETTPGRYSISQTTVTVPENVKKIIFNTNDTQYPIAKVTERIDTIKYENISEEIAQNLAPIEQDVDGILENSKRLNSATPGGSVVFLSGGDYQLFSADVKEGEKYNVVVQTSMPLVWAFSTASGIVISRNNDNNGGVLVVPRWAEKLYINISPSETSEVVSTIKKVVRYASRNNRWESFKWAALGDSLTDPTINARYKYHYYVARCSRIQLQVLGTGSTGYWRTANDVNFATNAALIAQDTDIVTIFGSINDWLANIPNGNPSDTISDNSLSGYMNNVIDIVMQTAPNAMIVLVSQMYFYGISEARQEELVATLKAVAEYRKLPFVDMYHTTMFDRIKESEFGGKYTTDYSATAPTYGHPNDLAHWKFIFPRFMELLAKVIPAIPKNEL